MSGTRTFLFNETLRTLGLFPDFDERISLEMILIASVRMHQYADTLLNLLPCARRCLVEVVARDRSIRME